MGEAREQWESVWPRGVRQSVSRTRALGENERVELRARDGSDSGIGFNVRHNGGGAGGGFDPWHAGGAACGTWRWFERCSMRVVRPHAGIVRVGVSVSELCDLMQ